MASITLSRNMILAIVGVISVGLVAAFVLFYSGGDGGSDDDSTGETWHEGDFVEWGTYYYEAGGQPTDPAGYTRYSVTEVGSQWLEMNITYSDMSRSYQYSQVTHVPANSTGFGYSASSIDLISYNVTFIGPDTVEFEDWGTLSADHYQYTYAYGGMTYTVDLWTRGGFIVVERTTVETGLQVLIMVTGTNLSQIYTP